MDSWQHLSAVDRGVCILLSSMNQPVLQQQTTVRRRAGLVLSGLVATLAAIASATQALAVELRTGDIVVADFGIPTAPVPLFQNPGLYQVDPTTGTQTPISSGNNFLRPIAITFEDSGCILVADLGNPPINPGTPRNSAVYRVDPITGTQTTVFDNPNFIGFNGIDTDARGNILVSDFAAAAILRINPKTGTHTIVSSGGKLVEPSQIVVDDKGNILVADFGANAVFSINPTTGAQTTVSSGGQFSHPNGITIDAKGNILVADDGQDATDTSPAVPATIFRVNPKTGAQTVVSSGGLILDLNGIDTDANGNILVSDFSRQTRSPVPRPAVYRVDPKTGAQTTVSSLGNFRIPLDLKVYKPVREHDNGVRKSCSQTCGLQRWTR